MGPRRKSQRAVLLGHLAEEVLVKVLGYLLARLGGRLFKATFEIVATWSLDTVNTQPPAQIAEAEAS